MHKSYLSNKNAASYNRNTVLNYIRHNSPVSRTDIWRNIGMSRATVTMIIRQLIEANLVVETEMGESSGGRKPCMLCAVMDAYYYIVFNWYTKTLSLCDLTPSRVDTVELSFPENVTPREFCDILRGGIVKLGEKHPAKLQNALGVGLAMPGMIDTETNTVSLSLELGWKDVKIGEMLEAALGRSVYVNRYSDMHALGECRYGTGGKTKDFLMYSIYSKTDIGVGVATIINGQVVYGARQMSGEIGHTSVGLTAAGASDAPLCVCGKRGCLELRIKNALEARYDGWKDDIARYSSAALAPIVNALDPEVLSVYIDVGTPDEQSELYAKIKQSVSESIMGEKSIERTQLCVESIELGMCNYMYNIFFPTVC